MTVKDFIYKANLFGKNKMPFFFLIDFELEKPFLCELNDALHFNILFEVNGMKNYNPPIPNSTKSINFKSSPVDFSFYKNAFNIVNNNLQSGNSYLLNLTFPTKINLSVSMKEIFNLAKAKYKLYFQDEFVIFSPECFVKTKDDFIYSYPMKGTIDAQIQNAKDIIMNDKKEEWEHNTIVDLIRNDLSIVSKDITLTRFRFITQLKTNKKNLLQVSSEIRGELSSNWRNSIGDILIKMLPAGSISGAPKQKTVEIIRNVEKVKRGYFTGIFGIFDGSEIDSAVNIRYIEKNAEGLQYRSGGGITAMSNAESEYNEMKDKVYVPTF